MTKITWNTDVNAPGCAGEILGESDGEAILIQTDWDWPGVAQTFGWSLANVQAPEPEFDDEPGPVHCDHDGAQADDPGYFC